MRSLHTLARRPRRPRRPLRRRALVLVFAVFAVLALLVPVAASGAPSPGDPASRVLTDPKAGSGITLTVTPASLVGVKQGDVVRLHFAGLRANDRVNTIGTCPAGLPVSRMDLASTITGQQACSARLPTGLTGDTDPTSLNTPGLSTYTYLANPDKQGTVDVDYTVGSGTSVGKDGYILRFRNGDTEPHESLVCDPTHPCTIGFVVQRADGITNWTDLTSLTVAPGPIGGSDARGCTGLSATATVTATGAERLQNPIAALDRAFCSAAASPIPVSYIPSGLGEHDPSGVRTVGTTSDLAFIGSPALSKAPLAAGQVRVPVALNAVSVAQMGGLTSASLTPQQIAYNATDPGPIALSTSDVARIVLHDYPTAIPGEIPTTPRAGAKYNPLAAAVLTRPGNAKALAGLDPSLIGFPFVMAPTTTYSVGVDSTAIALSSLLSTAAPGAWTFPDNETNRTLGRATKAVGPVSDFGPLVDRSTNGTILTSQTSSVGGLYSAKISKDITAGPYANTCPYVIGSSSLTDWQKALVKGCFRFAVMDTTTAAAISVTSARIASGSGYASPTAPTMQKAASGALTAAGYYATSDASAYPLTFVEYAVVPTAPLLDDACKPRDQQTTLKAFLSYAVGDGQGKLSTGLAPLTPALVAEAKAAIAQIGTGKPTGACAPKPAPAPKPTPKPAPSAPVVPVAPGAPVASGAGGPVVGGSGETSSGSSGYPGSTGSPATGTGSGLANTPAERAAEAALAERPTPIAARPVSADIAVASFQGAARTSTTSSLLGMLAIVLLLTIGAAAAAGLIPVQRLASAWRRSAGGRSAGVRSAGGRRGR